MTAVDTMYCAHCGQDSSGQDSNGPDHAACGRALELEPPRYCPPCGRRMVVQVTPAGWSARCVEHGTTFDTTWTG